MTPEHAPDRWFDLVEDAFTVLLDDCTCAYHNLDRLPDDCCPVHNPDSDHTRSHE